MTMARAAALQYNAQVMIIAVAITWLNLVCIRLFYDASKVCNDISGIDTSEYNLDMQLTAVRRNVSEQTGFLLGCHNLHEIKIRNSSLGTGVNKKAYLGDYRGRRVALKMATPDNWNSQGECIEEQLLNKSTGECSRFGNMKLMQDILLSQQLGHPNLIKLLGYCARSDVTLTKTVGEHGLIAIYEYGDQLDRDIIKSWSLQRRINSAINLLELLIYMEHSPIGNVNLRDLKPAHIFIVEGVMKMTDLDDATTIEHGCQDPQDTCNYGVPCIDGRCRGSNTNNNLRRLSWSLFPVFFSPAEEAAIAELGNIHNEFRNYKSNAEQYIKMFTALQDSLSEHK